MREQLSAQLKDAMKGGNKERVSTIRLIQSAIKDRDIANRGTGKEPAAEDEILQILAKMVKQREESAAIYEKAGRLDLSTQEQAEIVIIRGFMPQQLSDAEVETIAKGLIAELGASGVRDMGKVMAAMRERHAGQMDFAKASALVKGLLG
ncbi:MAG: GatB/YqeY domain-containing protein [Mesorhizobium sp.]|nr:GatB/YqeY domain-containing protein [Mesorhizobium sp.]